MERLRGADETGQTMAEYGLVLAVITVSIVLSFATLAGAIEAAIEATLELVAGIV